MTDARAHWVKMEYPGEDPVVVCEVVPDGIAWAAYHKTAPSQWLDRRQSPGGIDVGTVVYLNGLLRRGLMIRTFAIHYTGKGEWWSLPFSELSSLPRRYRELVQVPDKGTRDRVFLPARFATPRPFPVPRIPHDREVRIDPDGMVIRTYPEAP